VLKFRSTTQITLFAFGLVVIPLFIALLFSAQQLSKIDQHLNDTTKENSIISLESREIYNLLDGIERSSRQFLALNDEEFLNTARLFTSAVHKKLSVIESMGLQDRTLDISDQLKSITTKVSTNLTAPLSQQDSNVQDYFSKIRYLNSELNNALQKRTETTAISLAKESSKIKKNLLIISALLIPCTLLSISYFSRVINRPVAQLRLGIEKLGKQHLDSKIVVEGPKNLEILGKRLEWLRTQLKELEEQKKQFLSHVSHELKTPLTAIREGTELLGEQVVGPLNEKQLEINDILKSTSKQLQSQIEDLLTYNKSIIDADLSKRLEVPMDDLVKEAIEEQKLSIKKRKIKIKTSLKRSICRIDPDQILVVLRNLLSNAIKYSPPGGEILVSLKEKTRYVELNIQDSGPGIREEDRDHVFQAFFKGKRDGIGYMKGTGLGLAIVSQFIQIHKGEINLIDSDIGAHFRIRLPRNSS